MRLGNNNTMVSVSATGDDYQVLVSDGSDQGVTHNISTDWLPGTHVAVLRIDGKFCSFQAMKRASGYELWHGGYHVSTQVMSPRKAELASLMIEKVPPDMSRFLLCPMPGLIVALHVKEGDRVEAGQPLAVVELSLIHI